MFDHYIGLGYNCEVVWQLRRLSGKGQANVLDWHVVSHEALVHVLRSDFADYLQFENLVLSEDGQYVLDQATGAQVYHVFPTTPDGIYVQEPIAAAFRRVRARADHLLHRWHETVISPRPALYVRRDPEGYYAERDLIELRDVMREQYPSHQFAILWARDAPAGVGSAIQELAEGLYAADIHVARPSEELWHGDDAVWDRVFPAMTELRPLEPRTLPASG